MKIGAYVGSFNPVHIGHIHVVEYLLENNYVDKILLLPTPSYWDKTDLVAVEKRIEMLKFFENNKVQVDTIHNKYNYTYEVLRSLKNDYQEDEIYLIIGSDNIREFHKWKKINELLNYKIIVVKRDDTDIALYTKKFNSNNFIIVNDFVPINISSSIIRNDKAYQFLDKEVYHYIIKNNLY